MCRSFFLSYSVSYRVGKARHKCSLCSDTPFGWATVATERYARHFDQPVQRLTVPRMGCDRVLSFSHMNVCTTCLCSPKPSVSAWGVDGPLPADHIGGVGGEG